MPIRTSEPGFYRKHGSTWAWLSILMRETSNEMANGNVYLIVWKLHQIKAKKY